MSSKLKATLDPTP